MSSDTTELKAYDAEQERYMNEEFVILVDENDTAIGSMSKKESHLMTNILAGKALHRAFSIFLFNNKGELLLQQRSSKKITFALRWTNTVCSHPLHIDSEMEPDVGVKRAARRKLEHELGVPADTVDLDDFSFLTRIMYQAGSDGTEWGECEIDHILFMRKDDVQLNPNLSEVEGVKWVSQAELKQMFVDAEAKKLKITPWFHAIAESFLFKWWDRLDEILAQRGLNDTSELTAVHKLDVPEVSA